MIRSRFDPRVMLWNKRTNKYSRILKLFLTLLEPEVIGFHHQYKPGQPAHPCKHRSVSLIGNSCESSDPDLILCWCMPLSLCAGSWNSFYDHSHCNTVLACAEETSSSLRKWRHLFLVLHVVNWLTACPGKLKWLNYTLMISKWHCCDPGEGGGGKYQRYHHHIRAV